MRGPDGGLRTLFKQKLSKPDWNWSAIESGPTGRGIPDAHYINNGISGWVEYKFIKTHRLTLRPEQLVWIRNYVNCGGRVTIIVRQQLFSKAKLQNDGLYLIDGSRIQLLADKSLNKSLDGIIEYQPGGVRYWDWTSIGAILLRPV